MSVPQFSVTMSAPKTARIELYSDIGPSWAGMIDPKAISAALSALGDVDVIELHVNSRGGSAYDGLGIATMLRDHPAKKVGMVEGIAASAATLPLMVCDVVRIPTNALLMIHEPATIVFGGEDDMRTAIGMLSAVKKAATALYVNKSGKSAADIAAIMKAETWYTGDEAVAAGFADVTEKEIEASKAPHKDTVSLSLKEARQLPALEVEFHVSEEAALADSKTPDAPPADNKGTTPAAPVLTQADIDKAAQLAAETERKRGLELDAICALAGKPEMAKAFKERGASVEDARKEMYEVLCKERKPTDDGGQAAGATQSAKDVDAAYKAEYAEQKDAYMAAGIDEAGYVKMRRIDDGKDQLTPKVA